MLFLQTRNSLFITTNIDLLAHPNLDGEVAGSSPGHNKGFKMVLTAPQPVLVIITLSRGNAIAIERRSSYLIQWTSPDRGGIIQRDGCLIRNKKIYGPILVSSL